MIIKINGKQETIDKPASLSDLIAERGLAADRIVIEHNFRIVSKDELTGIKLKENDNIEIVSFVGGG